MVKIIKALLLAMVILVGLQLVTAMQLYWYSSQADPAHLEMVVELSEENYDDFVSASSIPVLVEFKADWCGPCRSMIPVVAELAAHFENRVAVAQIDTDRNANLAAQFRIQSIPTFLLVDQGNTVAGRSGASSREEMVAWINDHLDRESRGLVTDLSLSRP